jgi:hypothetical protein
MKKLNILSHFACFWTQSIQNLSHLEKIDKLCPRVEQEGFIYGLCKMFQFGTQKIDNVQLFKLVIKRPIQVSHIRQMTVVNQPNLNK